MSPAYPSWLFGAKDESVHPVAFEELVVDPRQVHAVQCNNQELNGAP
jgi:hypothetical protein